MTIFVELLFSCLALQAVVVKLDPIFRLFASKTTGSSYLQGGTLSFLHKTVHASLKNSSPAQNWIFGNIPMSAGPICCIYRACDPERKWVAEVRGNFTKFGLQQDSENAEERNRDRQVEPNPCGKSQESSNQRRSAKVSPSPVQGTLKSGFHPSSARGSGEKSDV